MATLQQRDNLTKRDSLTKRMLQAGMTVPFLYFGIQVMAAPFFPNYSFANHVASLLGSNLSTFPLLFNVGASVTGMITMIASVGILRALQKSAVHWLLAWLTFAVLLSAALGNVWAGLFAMPDPRHGANPFAIGLFITPFLLPVASWKLLGSSLRIYFLTNIFLFGLLVLFKSGAVSTKLLEHEGIFQRVFACVAFFPIAVSSYVLLRGLEATLNSSN